MVVVIPTPRHVGTHFAARYLFKDLPFQAMHRDPQPGGCKYSHHCNDGNMPLLIPLLEKYPAVVTIRHPKLVALTHSRRGYPIDLNSWKNLIAIIDSYNPYYLPIDSPDRLDYLIAIEQGLGIELPRDWKVCGSRSNTSDLKHIDLDDSPGSRAILQLPRVKKFFGRFY